MYYANFEPETVDCRVGDLLPSSKAKTAPVTFGGKQLAVTLAPQSEPLSAVFEFKAYDNPSAERVDAVFRCTEELEEWLKDVEAAVQTQLQSRTDISKHCSTLQDIQNHWVSCVKAHASGPSVKTKLNKAGPRACKVWSLSGTQTELPEDARLAPMVPYACLRSVWSTSAGIGVTWETTDLQVSDVGERNPFTKR